jgi:hypothetical protein
MKSVIRYISLGITFSLLFIQAVNAQHQLSLQEAMSLAVDRNPELAASKLEIDKSRQQKVISRSLFLPSVNASAQVNHYFQLTPFFGFGETTPSGKIPYGRFGGEDQFGAFLSAVQPLYNPLAFPSVRHSGLKEDESIMTLNAKRVSTLSLVKQTYLQLLVLNARLKLQRESINRNQRALQDARSLFIQGKGLRVDNSTYRLFVSSRGWPYTGRGRSLQCSKKQQSGLSAYCTAGTTGRTASYYRGGGTNANCFRRGTISIAIPDQCV